MTGTIALYDSEGERLHTIYLGATPEYGKEGLQGQRTLSSLRSKDLHQEVVAPTGDLAFSFDAIFRRMLFQ